MVKEYSLPSPISLENKIAIASIIMGLLNILVAIYIGIKNAPDPAELALKEREVVALEDANRIAQEQLSVERERNSLLENISDCIQSFTDDLQGIEDD